MTIVFIYNAKSGIIADMADTVRKLVSGKTDCSLCSMTFGAMKENSEWVHFRESLEVPTAFYHKDDMPEEVAEYVQNENVTLPVILSRKGPDIEVLVSSDGLDGCELDVTCLIDLLKRRLALDS